MASWDEQIAAYEAKIANLESSLDSLVHSASRAVLILSGIALAVGVLSGLLLGKL